MRKRTIIVTAVPLAIAGTVGAFAFVSQTFDTSVKSGKTTTATTPTGTVAGDLSDLAPNDARDLTLNVSNPNKFAVKVTTINFTVTVSDPSKCVPGDNFYVDPIALPKTVPAGDGTTAGTLAIPTKFHFADTDKNQAGCLNQNVDVVAHVS